MPVFTSHPVSPVEANRQHAPIDDHLDLQLFKALSDPTRLKVLSCLIKCGRACSVSEVAECCSVDFSVVNKHLKILAAADVVSADKQGRTVWYAARCGDLGQRFTGLVESINEWCPNLTQSTIKNTCRAKNSCCTKPNDRSLS